MVTSSLAFLVLSLDNLLQIWHSHFPHLLFFTQRRKDGQRANKARCLRPAPVLGEPGRASPQILCQILQPLPNSQDKELLPQQPAPFLLVLQPPPPKPVWPSAPRARADCSPPAPATGAPEVPPGWGALGQHPQSVSLTHRRACGFTLHFSSSSPPVRNSWQARRYKPSLKLLPACA